MLIQCYCLCLFFWYTDEISFPLVVKLTNLLECVNGIMLVCMLVLGGQSWGKIP